jgi:hypothetical protein
MWLMVIHGGDPFAAGSSLVVGLYFNLWLSSFLFWDFFENINLLAQIGSL